MLNTVNNVGAVLNVFDLDHPEWGVSEVARELGMPKSNVHALVASLVEIGLLARTAHNRYRLGWHLLQLSERMRRGSGLQENARPEMERLAQTTRETVLLSVLDRGRVLYVERVEGTHPIVRVAGVQVGHTLPLHTTAAGKVILADRSPDEALELLGTTHLTQRTENTITEFDSLMASLQRVRREGVGFSTREMVLDACCIAAPIRDVEGRVAASLSTPVPAYRFDRVLPDLRPALVRAAENISEIMGELEKHNVSELAGVGA